jgi:molybdenum cofactor biosynthesis enzyme MoaA
VSGAMTPQQAAAAEDSLLRLATIDIPAEQRRLKQIKEPNVAQVLQELSGTVLELVKEVARNQVELRDWNHDYMNAISDHVEALDVRMSTVETYGAETTITPEDAEVLAKAVLSCKYLATQLLQGPFPIEERDEEGKQKLAEVIAIAEQSEKIINDSTLVPDDDSDDSDDDEEDAVGPS